MVRDVIHREQSEFPLCVNFTFVVALKIPKSTPPEKSRKARNFGITDPPEHLT